MARTLGVVKSEIWEPLSDFRTLTPTTQWAYLMLLSQPQISNLGILPYTPEKWVRLAVGLTLHEIEDTIRTLDERRFTVTDRDTAELLVRTFIKHDKVWSQPKLVTNARRLIREVESDQIRNTLVVAHPWLYEPWGIDAVKTYETCGKPPAAIGVTEPLTEGVTQGVNEGVTEPQSPPRARARTTPAPAPAPTPLATNGSSSTTRDPAITRAAAANHDTTKTGDPIHDLTTELADADHRTEHVLRRQFSTLPEAAFAWTRDEIIRARPVEESEAGLATRILQRIADTGQIGDTPPNGNTADVEPVAPPKRTPLERALQMVTTVGYDYDPVALGHELDDIGVTDPAERRQVGLAVGVRRAELGLEQWEADPSLGSGEEAGRVA